MPASEHDSDFINGLEGILSVLIHNGKNHLGPIKGYASLIQDDTDHDSNARRWADKIMRNVREMEDHLHALEMFQLKGAIGLADISWHRVMSDVMDRFAAVNVRGVPIEIVNETRGTFRQHKELLKRVLVHLVVNAYESIERTGKITLSVREQSAAEDDRRRFTVGVTDSGCGMDGELMRCIWTPFFTTKRNHIGLGLPFVAAAAAVMKMDIEVTSTSGRGTAVGLVVTEQGG